jgi:SAM-dependent methyltransferase
MKNADHQKALDQKSSVNGPKARIPDVGYHSVAASKVDHYTPINGAVIDIGSGSGNLLSMVRASRPDLSLIAVDIDEKYLALTREKLGEIRTIKISNDGHELDNFKSTCDTVVMCHSLEHTLNPPEAIRRVLNLLNENGHLILAVPNPVRPTVFWGNIWKKHYVERQHVYAWDRSHWMNFLENIMKLSVVEYCSDEVRFIPRSFLRRFRILANLEWLFARLVPWWSFSNIAIIKKEDKLKSPLQE